MGLTEEKTKENIVIPEIEWEIQDQVNPEQEFINEILEINSIKDLKKLRAKVKHFVNFFFCIYFIIF